MLHRNPWFQWLRRSLLKTVRGGITTITCFILSTTSNNVDRNPSVIQSLQKNDHAQLSTATISLKSLSRWFRWWSLERIWRSTNQKPSRPMTIGTRRGATGALANFRDRIKNSFTKAYPICSLLACMMSAAWCSNAWIKLFDITRKLQAFTCTEDEECHHWQISLARYRKLVVGYSE